MGAPSAPSGCAARSGICLTQAGPAERRRVAHLISHSLGSTSRDLAPRPEEALSARQSQHTAEASWKAQVTSREGPLPAVGRDGDEGGAGAVEAELEAASLDAALCACVATVAGRLAHGVSQRDVAAVQHLGPLPEEVSSAQVSPSPVASSS